MIPADVPIHRTSVGATHVATASRTASTPIKPYHYSGFDHGSVAQPRIVNRRVLPVAPPAPEPEPPYISPRYTAWARAKRRELLLEFQRWSYVNRDHGPTREGWERWQREQERNREWAERNRKARDKRIEKIRKREEREREAREQARVRRHPVSRNPVAPAKGWTPMTGADIDALLAEL